MLILDRLQIHRASIGVAMDGEANGYFFAKNSWDPDDHENNEIVHISANLGPALQRSAAELQKDAALHLARWLREQANLLEDAAAQA